MNESCCQVRLLSKYYGKHRVLDKVSFLVPGKEHLAILGPSGSGKSTLLRLLAGLETPDQGEIVLNGVLVSEQNRIYVPPHGRGISMVFQDLALWPNLSALQNVRMGLAGQGMTRWEETARARVALHLCGIAELAQRKPGEMSGGQQQRVALARAIAARPMFLLLDEPYTGLDLVLKSRLHTEVRALADSQDMTVILVTHDPWEAMSLCRSAVVLDQGRVVEAGVLTDLLREPSSDLLRIFREEFSRRDNLP